MSLQSAGSPFLTWKDLDAEATKKLHLVQSRSELQSFLAAHNSLTAFCGCTPGPSSQKHQCERDALRWQGLVDLYLRSLAFATSSQCQFSSARLSAFFSLVKVTVIFIAGTTGYCLWMSLVNMSYLLPQSYQSTPLALER